MKILQTCPPVSNLSPSCIEKDLACCIRVGGLGPPIFSLTLTSCEHTRLCHPGNIRDICPAREISPNDMGHFGFRSPNLLVHNLSKSGSRPHACSIDINNWAISMVRLTLRILKGSGSFIRRRGDREVLLLGLEGLGFPWGGWWFGEVPPVSTLACIFCPTESAVSFTLAMIPGLVKDKDYKFCTHFIIGTFHMTVPANIGLSLVF